MEAGVDNVAHGKHVDCKKQWTKDRLSIEPALLSKVRRGSFITLITAVSVEWKFLNLN